MLPRKLLKGITLGFLVLLCIHSEIVEAANISSCYHCQNNDCEYSVSRECKSSQGDGKCFIQFDAVSNDVIELGCLADVKDQAAIQDMIRNKTLYICDGVNCNDFENLPQPNQCTECSSSTAEACATKPTSFTQQQFCKNIPYTQCYQRVTNGLTERGCLYDLKGDEFYNCLTGRDEKCKICDGKNCNDAIIPSNRRRCHRCSSDTDANCEKSPAAESVCPSYQENDSCVTVFENNTTRRGCRSEFDCNTKSKNCQVCSTDGCNTANIKKRFDDLYGVFQDLPLNCNTCKGEGCQQGKPYFPNKCEGDDYQDCMIVFDANGEVIRRGCENIVLAEQRSHCDKHPELCFKCKANGCNNMTDHLSFQECLYCDAATNPDCLFSPNQITTTRKCAFGCVTSLYPRKSSPKVSDFVRTCFEDIEPDNQELCTEQNNCVKCLDNKCNTAVLPAAGRLSCLHCDGSNCLTPTSRQCVGYNPNDMCYIYFDNVTFSAVRMGCRSDVADDELRREIKQYYICDGDDCNDYENLPEGLFCAACDSENDVNCAINMQLVTSVKRCSNLPYTHCFTRIREGGYTQRGCLSDLPTDDFISCHDGLPTSLCSICTESHCNKNIYPYNHQYCYRCNSTTDETCERSPVTKQYCPLHVKEDACVTQWTNGITRRDCASEITCDGLSYKNCRQCSKNSCNKINLANEDIGDLGLFTELPLRCYKCTGVDECKNVTDEVEVCTGNISQSCTTVFGRGRKVLARGCSDAFELSCSAEDSVCHNCKSNFCNVAEKTREYINCVHCDSRYNDDCTFNVTALVRTRKCYKSCMTALYPRTKDKNPAYELIRTCLDDKNLKDRNKCESSADPKCKSCTRPECNTHDLGSRKSCYHCKGEDCESPKVQTCRAVMDNDQCFVQWDERGLLAEMGCKSKYDPSEVDLLLKRKYLWLCDDDNCNRIENTPEPQACVVCSSRTNAECAIKPNSLLATTSCDKAPYTQCYSRILENGHTERGCLSNLEGTAFLDCLHNKNSTKCLACTGNYCNRKLYPSNRLSCQHCSSAASPACEAKPDNAQVCLLHVANDKCTTSIDTIGNTKRSCSSKAGCNAANVTACQECEGDNCNVDNFRRKADGKPGQFQSLPLTCLTCSNVKECLAGSSQQMCSSSEYCMTVFNKNGEVVRRGCSDTVEKDQGSYCDLNPSNCLNCNSNSCNKAMSLSNFIDCVYCDSRTNPDCSLRPSNVQYQRKCNGACMTTFYPTANNYSYELVRTCLDDKDADDQLTCLNDSPADCKACSSPLCNTHRLAEDRLSCYHCQGENCEEAEQSKCSKYKPDDQCFIQFNNVSDIVRMGCISDLDQGLVSSSLHFLYLCSSGNNCNSYDNIPTSTLCAQCNSNDDEACASEPTEIRNYATCSALPNTHCYTRINKDGSTQRGCINSLKATEINACLGGTDTNCATCLSDGCNMEIFPAERRSCHRCNTKDDSSCEDSPNSGFICPVYSEDQYCATKLVNGHTYRGCSKDFVCDDTEKQYCRLCHGSDNCNSVDLANNYIGYPGNWQGLPINCYTCIDEQCNKQTPIQACRNNKYQNCGTVFALNGSVVQRGCSDLIYEGNYSRHCEEHPNQCKFCKSSGCNLAKSLSDYGDCLFCEGGDSTDCIFQPQNVTRTRSCHKGCMTGLYPRKYEANPAFELARGCWDDLDLDDREDCKAGSKSHCQFCDGKLCNTVKIPERRLKCNVCSDKKCKKTVSSECPAFRENDQCFTLFGDNNVVKRMGCASDYDESELNLLSPRLLLCDDDNCNNLLSFPKFVSCQTCNSLQDRDCVLNPSAVPGVVCDILPHTECYTRVDENGVTERGCLSDVEDGVFRECFTGNSSHCEVCNSNNCNNKFYPKDRRSCLQCDSDTSPDCEDNPHGFAGFCGLYQENESCVTKLEGDRTIRGCQSEISCGPSNSSSCRTCNSRDNCNTINLLPSFVGEPGKWQDLPLNCYHCKGEECSQSNGTLSSCKDNNLQTCMTVFDGKGVVVQRGCSDGVVATSSDYCEKHADKCLACKSNGCNTAKSLADYVDCYFCDSLQNKNCSINFDSSLARTRKCQKSCMVALYPISSEIDPSYELVRSCLDDMELRDRDKCSSNNTDFCQSCHGPHCNTMDLPKERFECFKCQDSDCEDMKPEKCSSYHANDQCYVLFNNDSSVVAMGCRSEFKMSTADGLVRKKQMVLCNEKRCNAPENLPTPKLCSVCNSSNNSLCATNPNLVNNLQRCSTLPYTQCFTRINADGHTERGCLGSLEEEVFYGCLRNTDGLCDICVGDKCNELDVYPTDRTKCHQCTSTNDTKCASKPDSGKACQIYKEDDYCVTRFDKGITTRDCRSNLKCNDENDPYTCRICKDSLCNTVNMENIMENGLPGRWQDTPITCYTCRNETECSSRAFFRNCVKNPFQNCMTVFNSKGKVVSKGCSDRVESEHQSYCEKNSEKCLRCNSNGCNQASSLSQYVECLYCDTEHDKDCVANTTGVANTRMCYKYCMTALYPNHKEDNPSLGLSRSCYDDMDLDDRELCADGKKEYCQVCGTSKCNVDEMPEKRLSCYMCSEDECHDPKVQTCPTYRPDDKCFTRFDESRQVVAFGCRSQFSNEEADYLAKHKRLLLCDGDNCNSLNNIPAPVTCALCNSRIHKDCAVNPANVTGETECAALPFTQCYTRVLGNGATERGCLSNLYNDEFMGCLNGTSATCKACNGNRCNKEIFPESRRKCHICRSSSDADCETNPNSLSICSTYDPNDTCVTTIRFGITYRDCSSDLLCDVTDPMSCEKCSGDGCNTINLAQKVDDNFGWWQDLPLQCLSCSGDDCNSTETVQPVTCNLNNKQDCMTVFGNESNVIARGCFDNVWHKYCQDGENDCFNCKSNECNMATSKLEYTECIYCNSHDDKDCIVDPLSNRHRTRKCYGGCMTALLPAFNSPNSSYELVRSCLNDKELADRKSCAKGKDKYCSACEGNNCNSRQFPENRLSCFVCNEETCQEPVSASCPLFMENDQCFTRFDEDSSVSEMGCISSFRNQDLEKIIGTKRVQICSGSNCNSLDKLSSAQSCAFCDSKSDVACATSPTAIGTFAICSMLPYTSCYSKLTSSGHTMRGCLSDLEEDDFVACVLGKDNNCTFCNGVGCNREIFPADRPQCFSCSSAEESDCDSYPTSKMPCPIVSDRESCATALSGNVTIRGCKSLIYCDTNDSKTCRSCFGNECNSIDLLNKQDDGYHGVWQKLPLKCHTCEGKHCLHSLGPTVSCNKRNINQDCMTVFDEQGNVERRGCSDDVEDYKDLYCRQHPERCFKCKSNECNVAWSIDEYVECLFCDSSKDPLCTLNPAYGGFESRKCLQKCMVALKSPQQVIRSCLDDKEIWVQNNCTESDSKECASCSQDNCNDFSFPRDRLKCHVCRDSSCSASTSQYCETYDEHDFCFAKYENSAAVLLGCASSQNASTLSEWTDQNKLYKCKGNDCNRPLQLPKEGVCVSCASHQNLNCAQHPWDVNSTEVCPPLNSKCVTHINAQGHTVRGCFSNLDFNDQACDSLGPCSLCDGKRCNDQIYPANRQKCHICSSEADANCREKPSSLNVCPIYDAKDKCVSALDNDKHLERGCASQLQCSNTDSKYCDECQTDGCNTVDLPGTANAALSSLFLTLLMSFLSTVVLKY